MLRQVFFREYFRLWEVGFAAKVWARELDWVTIWNDVFLVVLVLNNLCTVVTFKLHFHKLVSGKEWHAWRLCILAIASWATSWLRQPFFYAISAVPLLASVALLWIINDHEAYGTDKVRLDFLSISLRHQAVWSVLMWLKNKSVFLLLIGEFLWHTFLLFRKHTCMCNSLIDL